MYRQLRIDDSMRDYPYLCSQVQARDYIIGEPKLEVHNLPTVEMMHLQSQMAQNNLQKLQIAAKVRLEFTS